MRGMDGYMDGGATAATLHCRRRVRACCWRWRASALGVSAAHVCVLNVCALVVHSGAVQRVGARLPSSCSTTTASLPSPSVALHTPPPAYHSCPLHCHPLEQHSFFCRVQRGLHCGWVGVHTDGWGAVRSESPADGAAARGVR